MRPKELFTEAFHHMKKSETKEDRRNFLLTLLSGILIILILAVLPTGYEDALIYQGTERASGIVTEIDNSSILSSGLIRSGEQICHLRIEEGIFKGELVESVNFLSGSLEKDKIFEIGDRAYVTISHKEKKILSAVITDHYRLDREIILAGLFAALLLLFAGKKGLQAILSFAITILSIWKILVPCCLKGYSPILVGICVTTILTVIIIFFVYGFDKRTITATLGSLLGVFTTCLLGILFTDQFHIHGAILSDAESLIYSGYESINLTDIFKASIFIGASGAMMDLAVDVTSAVHEIVQKRPDISKLEAIGSGLKIGRAAMGTMTTTLLLAYSGGYITLLMVFMAQGTPIDHILNYKYVSAEILDTFVGSFGLVTVAPFTAVVSGLMFAGKIHHSNP